MDASKFQKAEPNDATGASAEKVARLTLANDLRDIADELEAGVRKVMELVSTEIVRVGDHCESAIYLRSRLSLSK